MFYSILTTVYFCHLKWLSTHVTLKMCIYMKPKYSTVKIFSYNGSEFIIQKICLLLCDLRYLKQLFLFSTLKVENKKNYRLILCIKVVAKFSKWRQRFLLLILLYLWTPNFFNFIFFFFSNLQMCNIFIIDSDNESLLSAFYVT